MAIVGRLKNYSNFEEARLVEPAPNSALSSRPVSSKFRASLCVFRPIHKLWRVIRVKIKCTNFFQFEFRNKSFCVQLLSNCSSFSSLIFEASLFAYNYFLIAALVACLIVNEVYLGITCKKYFFLRVC